MSDNPHNEVTLKEALKAMIEHYRLKGKLNQNRIKSLWVEKMGPSIASYTKDIRLYKKKLYITIDSAALRQELSYGRDKIKNMLNEALGEEYIEEVVVR